MDVVPLLIGASAGQTGTAYDAGTAQSSCSLTVTASGSPSFSVQLQGSADAATWANVGSALTTATTSSLTPSPAARYFRAVLSGYTGPGTVTAKLGFTAGAGFTGASGVTLDTTASDIQALGVSASAGTSTKAAAADHQHPVTGLVTTSSAASGDLSGTYPSPSVAKIQGTAITSPPGGTTSFLAGNGTWVTPAAGVTLDSTAADIKQLGTQSAGSSTQAAKGDHVHPATGVVLTSSLPLAIASGGTGSASQNFADLTANQSIGGVKTFTGEVVVPTPVNTGDAVTKAYADAIAQGLSVKPSVQEATTAALPANTYSSGVLTATANGALTVDGIAVAVSDRVLVQNEAAAANNGIYAVTAAGSAGAAYVLTRAADMNTASQIPGAFAFCEQGTVNAGSGFAVASKGPFTIGTTAIPWTQFSGAGEVTAGTGLSKSGNTLSLSTPVAIANGGTGQTGAAAALSALGGAAVAGDIGGTSASPQVTATHLASALPAAQGGTGSATRNFAGLLTPTAVKTSAYTAAAGDFVPVDTTSGNVTITLPNAPADLSVVGVKHVIQGSTNTVTVNCAGSDVYNKTGGGTALTLVLLAQGALLQYKSSSGIWYICADDLALTTLDSRYLQDANNLSDLASASTARTNLGLGAAAVIGTPVSIANGGTGQTSASTAFNALSPNTTLGDITYGSGTNTSTRLAGSTSATKNFMTQTGNGTISAVPAWGTLAAADLPAATTSAQGAVILDGTATDIVALGTQAAGSSTKAAAANHVHPVTGLVTGVTATDTSIVVGGTSAAPTIATGTLDVIAAQHAPAAAVAMNSQKITGLANGSAAADAMAFGQQANNTTPSINNLVAWTWDLLVAGGTSGSITVGGTLYLLKIVLTVPTTLNTIWWYNTTPGATPTSGQSQVGIYSSAGTLVASATTSTTATAVTAANVASAALSTPYSASAAFYWVGLVFQAGTQPTLLRSNTNNSSLANLGLTTSTYRVAANGTGITTALPSSITTTSNSNTGSLSYWIGVS